MMNTVKNVLQSLGGDAGVARNVGARSAEVAKRVGSSTSVFARRVGDQTSDIAKRVGSSTADLARRIGPKRGLIGLAIAGVAIGGTIFLVRYLRSREEELPLEAGEEGEALAAEGVEGTSRRRRASRSKRKSMHAHAH
jgi:hypothetical protein